MRAKPTKAANPLLRWGIYRIRTSPAEFLGTVHALDEAQALALAVEQYKGPVKQLVVRELSRTQWAGAT